MADLIAGPRTFEHPLTQREQSPNPKKEMPMKLVPNWRRVLLRAWSSQVNFLSALLGWDADRGKLRVSHWN
jgi:hypothetical protein